MIKIFIKKGNKGLYFYVYGASSDANGNYITGTNNGRWHCAVATYTSTQIQVYVDGQLRDTKAHSAGSINNSDAQLTVGRWFGNTSAAYHWRGDLALVRHSTSIPSAEQIMIYGPGHFLQEEAGAEYAQLIIDFIFSHIVDCKNRLRTFTSFDY